MPRKESKVSLKIVAGRPAHQGSPPDMRSKFKLRDEGTENNDHLCFHGNERVTFLINHKQTQEQSNYST